MSFTLGVDLGTFHTVGVLLDSSSLKIPTRSIKSVAIIIGKTTIVGVDAMPQLQIANKIVTAPKLRLKDKTLDQKTALSILRKLTEQAVKDSPYRGSSIVLSVPPGWEFEECSSIKEELLISNFNIRFIHEPVALLVSLFYIIPRTRVQAQVVSQLFAGRLYLVCDWGAGTVDIALVLVESTGKTSRFKCIGEKTILGHGGDDIARRVVSGSVPVSEETRMSYILQCVWQGEVSEGVDVSRYAIGTSVERQISARKVTDEIEDLLHSNAIERRDEITCVLYGGPLESDELQTAVADLLNQKSLIPKSRIIPINSKLLLQTEEFPNLRRDALVAAGASIFGSVGETLPEFEYEILLKDSFGKVSSTVCLRRDRNLVGRQVVSPPYTNVDYFVEVRQTRVIDSKRQQTGVKAELAIFVRGGGVIIYQLSEADVGYVKIDAIEAQDLPAPESFVDSRVVSVVFPEKSSIFDIRHA